MLPTLRLRPRQRPSRRRRAGQSSASRGAAEPRRGSQDGAAPTASSLRTTAGSHQSQWRQAHRDFGNTPAAARERAGRTNSGENRPAGKTCPAAERSGQSARRHAEQQSGEPARTSGQRRTVSDETCKPARCAKQCASGESGRQQTWQQAGQSARECRQSENLQRPPAFGAAKQSWQCAWKCEPAARTEASAGNRAAPPETGPGTAADRAKASPGAAADRATAAGTAENSAENCGRPQPAADPAETTAAAGTDAAQAGTAAATSPAKTTAAARSTGEQTRPGTTEAAAKTTTATATETAGSSKRQAVGQTEGQ